MAVNYTVKNYCWCSVYLRYK